ncbi:DUF7835 family putative zinc beta-ribbon protein [Haladaptatus sp. NG-WS-4]
MSDTPPNPNDVSTDRDVLQTTIESCEHCGKETEHRISIELVTESEDRDNDDYSREPYRLAECCHCGHREKQRANNI